MSIAFTLDEVLDYSDYERRKWQDWIAADPSRLEMTYQPGGRFPTVGALLDHVFFVEHRHLSRMAGAALPEASGVPPGDWRALFDYADRGRADLRAFAGGMSEADGMGIITFNLPAGPLSITRRRLALHILLHEVRHLAQLAHTVRLAGLEPPGSHDYLFFPAVHEVSGT